VVGQWCEQEVVRLQVFQQQARRVGQLQVALEDATDQRLGQELGRGLPDQLVQRRVQRRAEPGRRGQLVLHELTPTRLVQHLRQQLLEVVDSDALVAQLLREGVVLLAGPLPT
jgi:hypothetical protein